MSRRILILMTLLTSMGVFEGTAGAASWSGTVKTLTFKTVDGQPLELDVYYPSTKIEEPSPAHIFIHGGGWTANSKEIVLNTPEGYVVDYLAVFERLAQQGYVGVSIDYRLAGDSVKVPQLVEDVNDAVRFLHKDGLDHGIDPNRMAVWGSSAGGHLALMVGLPPSEAFPGEAGLAAYPSTVRCVVSWYGIGDFTLPSARGPDGGANFEEIFGESYHEAPDLYRRMSPISHLVPGAVPMLLMTGDQDTTVLFDQSQTLHLRAQTLGLNSTYLLVKNSGHGWRPVTGPIVPDQEEIHRLTAEFIRNHTQ
ncbi:MAG: alpha/beta hydrolase [Acidobacteriota bacterium]